MGYQPGDNGKAILVRPNGFDRSRRCGTSILVDYFANRHVAGNRRSIREGCRHVKLHRKAARLPEGSFSYVDVNCIFCNPEIEPLLFRAVGGWVSKISSEGQVPKARVILFGEILVILL